MAKCIVAPLLAPGLRGEVVYSCFLGQPGFVARCTAAIFGSGIICGRSSVSALYHHSVAATPKRDGDILVSWHPKAGPYSGSRWDLKFEICYNMIKLSSGQVVFTQHIKEELAPYQPAYLGFA